MGTNRHHDRVMELLGVWEDLRLRGSEVPAEELCAAEPELAEALRVHILALRAVDSALAGETTDAHPRSPSAPAEGAEGVPGAGAARPRDGARFRVLRPHASGGLGAVYVALDAELNREVALKQILGRHAHDPSSRRRFLLEAEVTGGLEHPGIVPVYGLGTYDDGRPYYAMRFVRGETLKEAIARFHAERGGARGPGGDSLALRKLLRRFQDVCNAIDYAHGRGVLHRDIKPGNIVVGRHGETLVVDWGLAKATGRSDPDADEGGLRPSSGDGAETCPGSALGTPAYMSPEQARGDLDAHGPASDVYSLGATLYCLITGRPPFGEGDAGATLRAVREGRFPRPREHAPATDRALEAVCLKAMALDPQERYSSARALADDLDRWMADEPVSARPEPLREAVRRWVRRRRTAVTAAAAALVVASVGLAAVLAVQAAANSRLKTANRRLSDSVGREARANARVRARFDIAMGAIRKFHSGVSEDALLRNPELKGLRDRLLGDALSFYQQLGAQLADDPGPEARRALGRAHQEMAALAAKVGALDVAESARRRALALARERASDREAGAGAVVDVAERLKDLADLLKPQTERSDEALAAYEEARALLEPLVRSRPEDDAFRVALARADRDVAQLLFYKAGRRDEARKISEAERDSWQALVERHPEVDDYRVSLAGVHSLLQQIHHSAGEFAKALEHAEAGRAICSGLVAARPEVAEYRLHLASCQQSVSTILHLSGRAAEGRAAADAGAKILRDLVAAGPGFEDDDAPNAARRYRQVAILLRIGNLKEDAARAVQAELRVRRKLAQDQPAVAEYQAELGDAYHWFAMTDEAGGPTEKLEAFEAARAIQQKLADAHPEVPGYQTSLAQTLQRIGSILCELGRTVDTLGNMGATLSALKFTADGLTSYEAAQRVYAKLAAAYPLESEYGGCLENIYANVGFELAAHGRDREAVEAFRKRLMICLDLVKSHPDAIAYQQAAAASHGNLVFLLKALGRFDEAIEELEAADAIRRELAASHPEAPVFQYDRSIHLGALGWTLHQVGRLTEALEAWEAQRAVRRKLAESQPPSPDLLGELAESQTLIGGLLLWRLGRPSEARAELESALKVRRELAKALPSRKDQASGRISFRQGPSREEQEAEIALVHLHLGEVFLSTNSASDAISAFDAARVLYEGVVALDHYAQGRLASARTGLGRAHHRAGHAAEAATALRGGIALRQVYKHDWQAHLDQAKAHGLLAALAGVPGSTVAAEEATAGLGRAMAELRRAVAAGLRDPGLLPSDPDLASLRPLPEFRGLVMDLAFPENPFAGGR